MTTHSTYWVVEVEAAARPVLPDGTAVGRDGLCDWLWAQADGLVGIDEGSMTAAAAAHDGLVATPVVIDAAPVADRDWLATRAVATVSCWFADEASARRAAGLVAGIDGCGIVGVRREVTIDHEAVARSSFPPIEIAGFGVVRPAWDEGVAGLAADGRATIFIEPGLGFGTGLHETTQLCLVALADHRRAGSQARVLDYGSGSGILAIAAAVLGAEEVDAVEIDEHAQRAIADNARRNGVADRCRVLGRLADDRRPYDLVVANIVAPVLLEAAEAVCRRVSRQGGGLVLSGLLAADVPPVAARYAALLDARPTVQARGEWRALAFTCGESGAAT